MRVGPNGEQKRWTYFGEGSEGIVYLGKASGAPGLGGKVKFNQPIPVINRIDKGKPRHVVEPFTAGDNTFLKHLALYLLDKHFLQLKEYTTSHIPIPLGSYRLGYYYKPARGGESFCWEISVIEKYEREDGTEGFGPSAQHLTLAEFSHCAALYDKYGLDIRSDICESDDGRSAKNICLVGDDNSPEVLQTLTLPATWKRIDFGPFSLPFKPEIFTAGIEASSAGLLATLGARDAGILTLYADYLRHNPLMNNNPNLPKKLIGDLRALVGDWRRAMAGWIREDS